MFKRLVACLLGLSFLVSYQAANAAIVLYNEGFNADGVFTDPLVGFASPFPVTGSLDGSGLGTLTYTVTGAGTHNFIGYFDYEIDQLFDQTGVPGSGNGYTNEYGTVNGTPSAGQSWEIDLPGLDNKTSTTPPPPFDDALINVYNGVLDNVNDVPKSAPNDVSFALGWNFSLGVDQTATITMNMTDTLPATLPDFYLAQYDNAPNSANRHIYYWGDLSIAGQQPSGSVPEPGSLALFGVGLLMLGVTRKARKKL